MRVSQGNPTELVVIVYDIILEDIKDAKAAYPDDIDAYRSSLKHGLRFVAELMNTLDYTKTVSYRLLRLYEYVQRVMVRCDVRGNDEELDAANNVIAGLRSAFAKIAPSDTSGPVMQNTQKVYAGLTYGRNSLNETSLDPNSANRGFLA